MVNKKHDKQDIYICTDKQINNIIFRTVVHIFYMLSLFGHKKWIVK